MDNEQRDFSDASEDLSPRDAFSLHSGYAHPAAQHSVSETAEPSAASRPAPVGSSFRPAHLAWVLVFLIALIALPYILYHVQYTLTYGYEKARVDAAREGLQNVDASGLATIFRLVAQKTSPSVVHIQTTKVNGATNVDEWSHLFGPDKQRSRGEGSGVIVDEAGYIVTNHHVVVGAETIQVVLSDGQRVAARVEGTDVLTDLAVLKIDAKNLIACPWGNSEDLEVGDMVWAIGSPFGLDRTVTFGIVSAKGRRNVTNSPYQDFLQTDAAVNPGNSGGPLVNMEGEIVGINTAIVGSAYQGISFAIPSAIAKDVYMRLRSEGKVARGWLGVALQGLTPELAEKFGVEEDTGVLVANVLANSPASQAGIQAGDILVSWNGTRVSTPAAVSRQVAATKIKSKATVVLIREGKQIEFQVIVGERPEQLSR